MKIEMEVNGRDRPTVQKMEMKMKKDAISNSSRENAVGPRFESPLGIATQQNDPSWNFSGLSFEKAQSGLIMQQKGQNWWFEF